MTWTASGSEKPTPPRQASKGPQRLGGREARARAASSSPTAMTAVRPRVVRTERQSTPRMPGGTRSRKAAATREASEVRSWPASPATRTAGSAPWHLHAHAWWCTVARPGGHLGSQREDRNLVGLERNLAGHELRQLAQVAEQLAEPRARARRFHEVLPSVCAKRLAVELQDHSHIPGRDGHGRAKLVHGQRQEPGAVGGIGRHDTGSEQKRSDPSTSPSGRPELISDGVGRCGTIQTSLESEVVPATYGRDLRVSRAREREVRNGVALMLINTAPRIPSSEITDERPVPPPA